MLATARDHKRAFDGDAGPNTGGMGAFSPADNFGAGTPGAIRSRGHGVLCSSGLSESGVTFRGLLFPWAHDHGGWTARAGIQLPFRRPGNAGDPAAFEVGFARAPGGDDRRHVGSQRPSNGMSAPRSRSCSPRVAIPGNYDVGKPISRFGDAPAAPGRPCFPCRHPDGKMVQL